MKKAFEPRGCYISDPQLLIKKDIDMQFSVKGRVMPVTGIPPFVVTLGAPEVVKIRYAGESIDMSFLPSGRIANFNLPLSE